MTGVKEVTLLDAAQAPEPKADLEPNGLALVIQRLAENPTVDVAKLEKVIELQERVMRHSAEAAFNVAFSAMLPEIPTIIERAKADKTMYAPLEDIVEGVRPVLARHGFSASFRTEWPDKATVKVIGILTHAAGHARQSEFMSVADTTGSKNAIQALGSAVTYGKRYTLKDLLCIVTREEDDDGKKADPTKAQMDPDGFDVFLDVLASAAMNGTPALMAEFNKAPQPLRVHLTTKRGDKWDGYKKVATEASARATKGGGK